MLPDASFSFKRPIYGVANVIAVGSGKGGVGKTTTAVNLALALARKGVDVGLYDADLYGPNVPLMLGVRRKMSVDTTNPANMLPVARKDGKPYIPPLKRFGLKVMSLGLIMGTDDAITPETDVAGPLIRQTLQDVKWGALDYLLIDLPPGTGEPQRTLLDTIRFDGAIIVTTPQDMALMDASRSLQFFRKSGVRVLGLVENMAYLHCPHCGEAVEVFHRSAERAWAIDDQEAGAAVELLGRVPMDIAISRGIDANHPLVQNTPDAPQAAAFHTIADKVIVKLAA